MPFLHWSLNNVLPLHVIDALERIPSKLFGSYTCNGLRAGTPGTLLVTPDTLSEQAIFQELCGAFADADVIEALEHLVATPLAGTRLRIGLCVDRNGFWLKPHTDILAKRLTVLVYVSQSNPTEQLGTDLFDREGKLVKRVSSRVNSALLFRPGENTYHGFIRRRITGERRVLVVNYVGDTWVDSAQLTGLRVQHRA